MVTLYLEGGVSVVGMCEIGRGDDDVVAATATGLAPVLTASLLPELSCEVPDVICWVIQS